MALRMSPVEICGMPYLVTSSCACVPFPTPGAPKRRTGPGRKERSTGAVVLVLQSVVNVSCLPTSSPADAAALGGEAVIVAHYELRLNLLYSVHCHSDDNQQG